MGCLYSVGIPSRSHAHPLSAPVQEVVIVPLLPMALVALDEMDKNSHPLYRFGPGPGLVGEGGCWGWSLQRLCFCQHSCQGEVLASRKDFRMNTCTPHPRGAFMLEPVGLSPRETLLPRKGEGAGVGLGVGLGLLTGHPPSPVTCPTGRPAGAGPSAAPSAHSCSVQGPALPPQPWLLSPWESWGEAGAGLACLTPSLSAGCAEEQPMEVSMIRSPVPVPGISQESGEKRSSWWTD